MANVEKLKGEGIFDPPGYHHIMKVTGISALLVTAGQVPFDKDGNVAHPGDFLGQARTCFAAIGAHVKAAGGTPDDIIKITTYVTDIRNRPQFRTARDEFFGKKGPASTMVEVNHLSEPGYLIEIEAIAVI
jgi:2-iminobutanoate/2-iminopropanoate deaminase